MNDDFTEGIEAWVKKYDGKEKDYEAWVKKYDGKEKDHRVGADNAELAQDQTNLHRNNTMKKYFTELYQSRGTLKNSLAMLFWTVLILGTFTGLVALVNIVH